MDIFMDPDFELPISLPSRDSRNLLRALHGQLRAAILDGRLQPGSRLPPTRALAAAYGVSRNTAVAAYDLLLSEGYLSCTRPRAGAYVADVRPRSSASTGPRQVPALRHRFALAGVLAQIAPFLVDTCICERDFDAVRLSDSGVPGQAILSVRCLAAARQRGRSAAYREAARPPTRSREGLPGIARGDRQARFVRARRSPAGPETSSSPPALSRRFDLLARILITLRAETDGRRRESRVIRRCTRPSRPPARKIVPVQVDRDGIRRRSDCRPTRSVICVTPSHQFPLGTHRSIHPTADGACSNSPRRMARSSSKTTTTANSALAAGRSMRCRRSIARAVGLLCRDVFEESRSRKCAWVLSFAPPWARPALVAAKQLHRLALCGPRSTDTLAAFIAEGHLARHVRKMRQVYGARSPDAARLPEARFSPLAGADSLCRWIAPGGAFENVGRRRRTGGPGSTRGHRNLFVAGILFRQDRPARIGVRLRRDRRARYRRRLVARSTSVVTIGGRQVKVTLPWRRSLLRDSTSGASVHPVWHGSCHVNGVSTKNSLRRSTQRRCGAKLAVIRRLRQLESHEMSAIDHPVHDHAGAQDWARVLRSRPLRAVGQADHNARWPDAVVGPGCDHSSAVGRTDAVRRAMRCTRLSPI